MRSDWTTQTLAVGLSALAGFVDAIGFLETKGLFVSFMSGNSTQLGVGLVRGTALAAGALVAAFVAGVVVGTLAGRVGGAMRGAVVLGLLAGLLASAAAAAVFGERTVAVGVLAVAMGAENTTFERNGEVRLGVTYMTGALVKLGARLAVALLGGPGWGWLPPFLLWLGLVAGATAGAAAYPHLGLASLTVPAGFALLLAVVTGMNRRLRVATA